MFSWRKLRAEPKVSLLNAQRGKSLLDGAYGKVTVAVLEVLFIIGIDRNAERDVCARGMSLKAYDKGKLPFLALGHTDGLAAAGATEIAVLPVTQRRDQPQNIVSEAIKKPGFHIVLRFFAAFLLRRQIILFQVFDDISLIKDRIAFKR